MTNSDLVGYKGDKFETGYIYAPYIPIFEKYIKDQFMTNRTGKCKKDPITGLFVYTDHQGSWYSLKEDGTDFHRLDGPAIDLLNGDKQWWVNGRLHRLNGPAVDYNNHTYLEYYINGQRFDTSEYWTFVKKFKPEDIETALDLLDI